MKQAFPKQVEAGRVAAGNFKTNPGDRFGAFDLRDPATFENIRVIACCGEKGEASAGFPDGTRWDHVSVSCQNHPPRWGQMAWIKSLFFEPTECVIEYHPPEADYVNCHPNVLHLWRPLDVVIPMPPKECV